MAEIQTKIQICIKKINDNYFTHKYGLQRAAHT